MVDSGVRPHPPSPAREPSASATPLDSSDSSRQSMLNKKKSAKQLKSVRIHKKPRSMGFMKRKKCGLAKKTFFTAISRKNKSEIKPKEKEHKEHTNVLDVKIKTGDIVAIGVDEDEFYIAETMDIQENQYGGHSLLVTYYDLDDNMKLNPSKQPKSQKLWSDKCPANSVIMNLGRTRHIDQKTHEKIKYLTRDFYGQT